MPHIELFKNNNIDYLRICEGIYVPELKRQKKIILKNIGPLSKYDDGKPDFIKRFREKFKNGEIKFDGFTYSNKRLNADNYNYSFVYNKNDINLSSIKFKNLGYYLLDNIFNNLGISDVLNKYKSNSKIEYDFLGISKLLVYGRILNPQSKSKTFESKDNYFSNITISNNLDDIYKSLTSLNKISKKIQNRMNTKIKNSSIGRDTSLTYYDVTNYYYETMYGDDDEYKLDENNEIIKDEKGKPIIVKQGFRKKGVSKENQKGPIVQMGLFIDNNGIPVSHKLFRGNTQDKTTFKNVLENDVDEMDLGRIVVVADNGMNTQENKYLVIDKGNGYIVSKSVKKSWNKIKDWALNEQDYINIKNNQDEITFKYKSRVNEIELIYTNKDKTKSTKIIKEKEIIYWSKKHYERELHENEKFIEYLESCKENPDKLKDKQRKSQEFIKTIQTDKKTGEIVKTKEVVVLLDEKIQKYKETLGFYSIVTSEIEDNEQEIINRYHGLSRIEDSFRIIKSDLEGRPIYVWTEEHIKAHFLICFIALTIIRILQYKILKYEKKSTLNVDGWEQGITAEKIREAIVSFGVSSDNKGICLFSKMEDELKTIFYSNNIDYTIEYPTLTEVNKFKNRIQNSNII